jgi:hypothetical protein
MDIRQCSTPSQRLAVWGYESGIWRISGAGSKIKASWCSSPSCVVPWLLSCRCQVGPCQRRKRKSGYIEPRSDRIFINNMIDSSNPSIAPSMNRVELPLPSPRGQLKKRDVFDPSRRDSTCLPTIHFALIIENSENN